MTVETLETPPLGARGTVACIDLEQPHRTVEVNRNDGDEQSG